ncbi:uncharacterized protein LOC109716433 isoform X2 [Ananas comosus]|uniref:Uncharacterized protein LOC109716433 isoform X2 n=1 Tax=Ananas comosus TaxID=4615 RepID=A0A6P5FWQ5_ANACO|nr:uncharacterized protein LOC109716433 isoform X2 [Ananas comosus]
MIAGRSFARFNQLCRTLCSPNPHSHPLRCSQGLFHQGNSAFVKMSGRKGGPDEMDQRKKKKAIMHVWRPITTKEVPNEVDNDERSDSECQLQSSNTGASITGEFELSTSSAIETDNELKAVEEREDISYTCRMGDVAKSKGTQQVVIKETHKELGSNEDLELATTAEKVSVSVQVDTPLIRFVKGKGGSVQKRIEVEAGVKIKFPSAKGDTTIVVEGDTVESVTKASEKIASVLEEAVKSPMLDYSHFISLPLAIHPDLVAKLHQFQGSILGYATTSLDNDDPDGDFNEDTSDEIDYEDKQAETPGVAINLEVQDEKEHVRVKIDTKDSKSASKASSASDLGIDRSIFIKPKTFHLTVLMLKLWNKDRVAAAAEVLQRVSSEVKDALENRPISIQLRGLACMRGSLAKAQVIYAPVLEVGGEGRLLRACQVIIGAFVESGLVLAKDAKQSLKLHATLMNVRHRKRSKRNRRNDSFEARHIFKVYGSKEWGEYLIREVHLSQRFKFDESGYYHCCSSISLPEDMQTE